MGRTAGMTLALTGDRLLARRSDEKVKPVMDLVCTLLIAVLAAASFGLIGLCERLSGDA
jgi:hypothetical protein